MTAKDAPASQADASFAEITARRRGRLRRYLFQHPRVMDALVVLTYCVLIVVTFVEVLLKADWLAAALLVVMAVCLIFRRRAPVAVLAAVAVLEVGVTLLHPWGSNVSAGLWFALYTVAVTRTRRFSLIAMALANAPLASLYFFTVVGPGPGVGEGSAETPENYALIASLVVGATITLSNVVATGIGISVRERREHEQAISAWAGRTAQLGSVNERNRIAREMHDVVAHSLTVMVTLSDGAAVVVKKSPQHAGEVLGELSRTGRSALADMRRVLGVLRDDSTSGHAPRGPLAAGDSLDNMLAGFRTAGLPLHYSHAGPALPTDAAFQLTVYRIVQESLTNVLRYGRALSRVEVSILRNDSAVIIEVLDDGKGSAGIATLGTGQGLDGMRERARIFAGTVEAGRVASGGWRVRTVLKWNGDGGTT